MQTGYCLALFSGFIATSLGMRLTLAHIWSHFMYLPSRPISDVYFGFGFDCTGEETHVTECSFSGAVCSASIPSDLIAFQCSNSTAGKWSIVANEIINSQGLDVVCDCFLEALHNNYY